ncbi:MAG: hybrid sensor histidine kinase/response regulator, partial [Myxococcota bacterium]
AHDFNNQIAGILGYADFIKENCTEKKNQLYADRIIKCAKNAADLTQKVLAYSRKANFENIKVDVNELVDEAVAILERTIDKKIKLSVKKRSLYPVTRGDPTMLQNALLNLCINARDAMPHGGELIIETKNTRINDEFVENHHYEMKQGEYIRISITDNGMGISKPDLEKIFEPFFTTKTNGKGTGMGLAAVYGTVKGHRGGINVYSEPGLGSTFNFYLPVYRERKVTANLTEKIKIQKLDAKVLLVDDDDSVRDVLSDMLQYFGCSVFQCNNGQEGVSFYKDNYKNIDLVIMDLVMPKMNGREAFLEMKKINNEIKSLLISGYSLNRNLEITLSEGASGFIQKPFSKENFFRKIVEIID